MSHSNYRRQSVSIRACGQQGRERGMICGGSGDGQRSIGETTFIAHGKTSEGLHTSVHTLARVWCRVELNNGICRPPAIEQSRTKLNHCRRDCCKNHKVTTPPPFKSLEPAKRVHKRGVPVKGCGHKVGWEEPSGSQCVARGGCTSHRRTLQLHVIGCAQGEAVRNLPTGPIKRGALGRSSTSPLCRQSNETARQRLLLTLIFLVG